MKGGNTIMEYIDEGFKDTKIGKKSEELGAKLNKGLNTASNAVAKQVTRKPKNNNEGSYEQYKRNFNRWRVAIKGTGVAVAMLLTPKPFDIALCAALMSCVQKSDDPTDVAISKFIRSVSSSVSSAKNKLASAVNKAKDEAKDQKLSDDEAKKKISMLDTLATNYTKLVDAANRKIQSMRDKKSSDNSDEKKSITESTEIQDLVRDILYDNGEITLESYDAVSRFIERADYSNERDVLISEACIDLLLEDCGL